jgi:integrase
MASIRKRNQRWQVQVRRKGHSYLSKTFDLKRDAETWARETERALERGNQAQALILARETSFDTLLKRYGEEISPAKRGAAVERYRIRALRRQSIAEVTLANLRPADFARYRDERLARVQAATVLRELSLAQRVLEVAIKEWGYSLPENPAKLIAKPKAPPPRERRLYPAEEALLLKAARRSKNPQIYPAIVLALETAMRRGELLSLKWRDVDLERRLLTLHTTKTGRPRTIPLSQRATDQIRALQGRDPERILPGSANALRLAWQRLTKRNDIEDLTFHDLRHEAVSRLFEKGLSIPEVALISGHRDPRMLFHYTHLKASDLVHKL